MRKRAELEAALAHADAGWCRANKDLDLALAGLIAANADWDKVVSERRKTGSDRRKAGSAWDNLFPDRRNPSSERRNLDAQVSELSKAVADRDSAYNKRSNAEAELLDAESRMNAMTEKRNDAIKALDGLARTEKKP